MALVPEDDLPAGLSRIGVAVPADDLPGAPTKKNRSYLGAALESGVRTLGAAGATVLDAINPFTLSEEDAATLYKDDPEGFKRFQEESAAAVLQRFAAEQTKRSREVMQEVSPDETGAVSGNPLGELEYATLDPEKAAYLSPTRVAGDVLQSLPSTLALAVSGYFTRGKALQAYEQALARETAKGVTKAEAQAIARAEAVREGAKSMAVIGGGSEGVVTGAQQFNQALDQVGQLDQAKIEQSPEYQALLDEGYAPETARATLANRVATQSGVTSGVTTGLISAVGGRYLGGLVGEGGSLLPRVGKGFLIEGATEAPQSTLEQINQNVAMQRVDPSQNILEGAGEAAAAGFVVGGVTGGAFGAAFGGGDASRQRQKVAEQALRDAPDAATAAAAANELAGSVADLEAAINQYLTPTGAIPTPEQAAATPAPEGLVPREDPTRAMIDRQAGLIAEAQAAPTAFDRQLALDQAQTALPQPEQGRSAGFVDLTPMNDMQAQQRLAVLRDETARAGGNALALAIVPHPAQADRFAIAEQALPDLSLPQAETNITPDQAQFQIESAALGGQVSQARAEDSATRGPVIDQALKAVEARGGVASPAEARIFQEAGIGQPYDRVDPTLGPESAPLIETAGASRESFTPNQQIADQEVQADQQARRQSDLAQRDRQLQGQIAAAGQARPAPDAGAVISALVTPGRQRSAEQVRIVNEARNRYSPEDFSILERAATAPFQLNTPERMRLRELRNPPAVPQTSTTVPESGTGLLGTRVAERLGQPSGGRIITTNAKLSTQRVSPGGTVTINDGGTQHEARVVETSRLGTQGRLLQQIARLFNKRLVVFESDTLQADGFVRDGDNESIYLNAKSQISVLAVFGHELTHLLKRDNPQAYAALEAVVRRELREGATAEFAQDTGYDADASLEELTSDLVGNRFQEPDFWQSVFDEIAAQNPEGARGIIARLAAAINRAINAFRKLVTQPGFDSDQYIKDISAVKRAVNQALVAYMQQPRVAAEQATEQAVAEVTGEIQAAGKPSMAERLREAARAARTEMGETVTATRARNQGATYNVSDTNLGADNARISDTGGDRGLPADTGPDRSGAGEAGRGEIPSYGQPRDGAISVVGRHYSRGERQSLSGTFYGSGLRGAEARRLADSPDPRLRQRIYFYVDQGQGVRPEAGVGSIAHEVRLDNIYDPSTRLIGPQEDANSFESAVINEGFDGYLAPFGNQGAVVLLGPKHTAVPVQRVGEGAQFTRRRREVPENIDNFARLEQVFPRARAGSFNTNRELKVSLQDAILAAARQAGVDLSGRTAEVEQYLVRVGVADALYAIRSNANAVGWYDKTVTKALKILGKLHPEINTDSNAKFAFTWALAVTSNGQKVDKNFELAEAAYKEYKRTGRMPSNLKAGQAQSAINEGLELFNTMVAEYGIDNVRQFMDTKFLVSQIERATGLDVGGEFKNTEVRGAAVLGPKIGNGFFSNLNGFFDQLTMDRWLMRTWGRWTGSLIQRRPDMIRAKREELRTLVAEMKKNAPAAAEFQKALGQRLTVGNPDALAQAIQKASMDPATREKFNKTPVGESLRKTGNALAKYIDGQKEAPAGPEERNFIRQVFAQILDGVRERGFASLTMSDLQALLWYPEKRLYDTAKSDDSAQEGYADDEAPDYANAAAKLARANGVSNKDVQSAIREAETEYETRERARSTRRDADQQEAQAPAQGGVRGFTEREKRQFLTTGIVHRFRSDRERDEAASGPYARRSGGDGKGLRVLGQSAVAVYSPAAKFKNALGEIPAAAPKFFELDAQGAQLFQDAIQASKDATPFGAAVYVYPLEDYQGMRLFVTPDAKAGFALKGDDIVSVFAGPEQRGAVNAIMQLAIQEGGRRLDAFDTVLPDLYAVHGFKIVARSTWNDEFAPEGWNKSTFQRYNGGEPDVVFMVYDPTYFGAPSNTDGEVIENYDDGAVKQREALGGQAKLSRQRGINVRNGGDNRYADLIVDGEKTVESRDSDSLRPYVGQKVGIIRTGEGPAKLIGTVKIGEPVEVDEQEFRARESEHLVPEGSEFDIKPGSTKFLYPLTEAERFDDERDVDTRGIVARQVQFSRGRNVDLSAAAAEIAAMDPEVRDNTEIGDFPGGAAGYALYEARQMLKKPSDKLKRITENNSFSLWQSQDYIANVDGDLYGVTKQEDPDDPDDDTKFVYAFQRLDDPDQKLVTTTTDQVDELFKEMRASKGDAQLSRRRNYGSLTAAQEQALRNVGGIVPEQTVGDRMKELGDKFKKSWFSGIFDQFAPLKDVDQRAYMLARLSKGSDGALEALMLYGKPFMNGDVPDVKVNDEGFIQVMASLKGEHDRFLWWVAAQRAENLKAQGRENLFTDQDISSLKSLNQGNFEDGTPRAQAYANALAKMNEFNDAVLNIAEQSGLIDGQARQLFKDMPYVPFYRVMEDGVEGPSFSSGLVNQQAWKKLKGGTQKLNEDLLSNVLLNWAHLFDAAGKNRAAVASMQAATQIGIAQQVPAGTKGAVKVMEQGQTKHYTIDDPYIMEAVTALNYQPPGFFSPFSTFKKWLTIGVTASPTFKIKNLMRDSLQAIGTAPMNYNVASNVMKGFKQGSQETQTFASMLAGGGLIRFGSMLDGTNRTNYMIERQGGILLNEGGWKKLQRQMTGLVEAYAELGDRLENVNRVSLYEHLLSKGYSQAEANFMSRDLMDFSLQGRWPVVRFLAQSVPFLNARLQGLSKLGRGAKEDPRRFGYVVGAVALASIALMLAYEDDEDWKKRPDWDRDANWWFKIGDTAFRIPKPFEIGAIGTVAERTWELAFNDEMSWKRYRQRLSHMIFETFAMDPTPQLVVPIAEIYANKEGFTGRPIEGMSLEKLRPEDRATESTSSVARVLGQMGLPNPVSLVKGSYEKLSPVQIDHLIRGYFGWIGTTASNILDFGLRPLMDRGERPAYRLKDVFVVGNFAEGLPAGSSRYVDQLYEQARIIEQAYMSYRDAVKKGDRERAKELLAEEGDKIRAYKPMNKITDRVSEINRKIRQIDSSRTLSAETKRKMIDQLSQQKDRVARQAQRFATID